MMESNGFESCEENFVERGKGYGEWTKAMNI